MPVCETVKSLFLQNKKDREVLIKGWVKTVRKSKKFSFIVVNDGSCGENIQVVANDTLARYEKISSMLTGTSIEVTGKLVGSMGKGQSLEIQAQNITILGSTDPGYPLQKKALSPSFLREKAHLRARTDTFSAVFRLRHKLAMATHKFFDELGFYYLHTPIITGYDAEGAGELFSVSTLKPENPPKDEKGKVDYDKDYFASKAYLAVSGQLEAECFALGMRAVYTFGPTFRSENSNTPRHLAEFWMIEPEVAFADLNEISSLAAQYIKHLIDVALNECPREMQLFAKKIKEEKPNEDLIASLSKLKESDFVKITYTEAVDILLKSGLSFEYPVKWGHNLQTEHERMLAEKHFKAPLIVTDYPKDCKAFYMKQNPDNKTVGAFDVLVPGVGEIVG
ncbi:MAG: asparagine--tRNA ligase, partial [Halobacteriovoraceae bacterium]|nr:asparagine--tRNA ligase [Halobacteriovoraceae bacterium]